MFVSMPTKQSIFLIRHAPATPPGFLYGRTDPDAHTNGSEAFDQLVTEVKGFDADRLISSPAKRCQQTAEKLCEILSIQQSPSLDTQLWEQDFGSWDGLAFQNVPDIGELTTEELVTYKDHGGESFQDVCERIWSALEQLEIRYAGERLCIVAHAGVLRAASEYRLGRSVTKALMPNPKPLDWLIV